MAYTALYRKFRPQTFSEVKGQDHIVTALSNQIKTGRISHAYLFTGTRGTGKTTMARIMARAVNCEHPDPETGEPCGECEACKEILANRNTDIIEMDAASNRGVSDVQQLITEQVKFNPGLGHKYKVFIIDEVHMLSDVAFNALLKTVEEPPEYVIFILATTDVQEVPVTILSRVQRWDFHRISIETIMTRLQELMDKEGIEIDEQALRYIAKCGDGSMRDSLSILDKCVALYTGEKITYDDVLGAVGTVDTEAFTNLFDAILKGDVSRAIGSIEDAVNEGKELQQYASDFLWYLRNVLMAKNMKEGSEDFLDVTTETFQKLKEQAAAVDELVTMRYIRVLSDTLQSMKYSTEKRVLLEISIIKMCKPEMEQNLESLYNRMKNLEKKLESGDFVSRQAGPAQGAGGSGGGSTGAGAGANASGAVQAEPEKKVIPEGTPEDVKMLCARWNEFIRQTNDDPLLKAMLQTLYPTVSDKGVLTLIVDTASPTARFSNSFFKDSGRSYRNTLLEGIRNFVGKEIPVEFEENSTGRPNSDIYEDAVAKFQRELEDREIEIQIEEIDDDDDDF